MLLVAELLMAMVNELNEQESETKIRQPFSSIGLLLFQVRLFVSKEIFGTWPNCVLPCSLLNSVPEWSEQYRRAIQKCTQATSNYLFVNLQTGFSISSCLLTFSLHRVYDVCLAF